MELKQKKNQEGSWTEQEKQNFNKIIKQSQFPIFKLLQDLQNKTTEHHETFFIFFLEKSDYQKQLDKINNNNDQLSESSDTSLQKSLTNQEMKTRSIYKQPIRIQLLINAIIKGSVGDKSVDKQYAFSQLFLTMKNEHTMHFIGEGFFDMYYISVYKCKVTDDILDHLLKKVAYVCKESETVMIFKNESLNLNQDCFQDFFLPQEDDFKYYSVSDYLKKATQRLWDKAAQFLKYHDNSEKINDSKEEYSSIFADLTDNIYPDPNELVEYKRRCGDNPRYKLELCNYYKTNSCIHKMNSIKCKYAHGEIELREDSQEEEYNNEDDHSKQDDEWEYNYDSDNNNNNQDNRYYQNNYNNNNNNTNNNSKKQQNQKYLNNNNTQDQFNNNNNNVINNIKINKKNKNKQDEKATDMGNNTHSDHDSFFETYSSNSSDQDSNGKRSLNNKNQYQKQYRQASDSSGSKKNKVVYQQKQDSDDQESSKNEQDKKQEGNNKGYNLSMFCQA